MKPCVLDAAKQCDDCGACDDRCELDPKKICDNCFRCLDTDARSYAEIPVTAAYMEDDYLPDEAMHLEQRRFLHVQTLYGLYAERLKREQ